MQYAATPAVLALLLPCVALGQSAAPEADTAPALTLPPVEVVAPSPLLGSGMDRTKVPSANQVITSQAVSQAGAPSYLTALQDQAQGVQLNSAAGGPFQPNLFYHGFQAAPLQGTPQGLAVYLNGIRFNQAFGDTVNFDLVPDIAIDTMNLEGANPVFGLNALGGSLAIRLKNGFTYQGGELDAYGGSFGQIGGAFQFGRQAGTTAAYIALSGIREDGWRRFQSSGLKQLYGDVGWRGDRAEVHVNIDLAQTALNAVGTAPVEWLAADPRVQFTGPSPVGNAYGLVSVNGTVQVSDTTSVQGVAYYDYFRQKLGNGNVSAFTPCATLTGLLCEDGTDIPATTRGGGAIPDYLNGGPYATWDSQTTNTNGYGAAAQVANEAPILGHGNHVVTGVSFDGSGTLFAATTGVGGLDPATLNFIGPAGFPQGIIVDQADGSAVPVRLAVTTAYYGLYLTDTFDLTSRLSLNLAGRVNVAQIDLNDRLGSALTGRHSFTRFNPGTGLTWRLSPAFSLYASYAESNRAPTPAELSCASPASPCSLANFFTGDPALKQVVAHTIEAGLRGRLAPSDAARLDWNVGLFHTDLDDDIAFVQSVVLGRGFFQNVGATRRQGVDAGLRFKNEAWTAWADYTWTDATFQSSFVESSPNNPAADAAGTIRVRRGDRLPGVPAHLLKIGVQVKATEAWTLGLTGVAAASQVLFGDEANLTKPLPGYFVLNFNTSYQVTPDIQVFGLVQNVLDTRYYVYGTFSPTSSVAFAGAPGKSNPRSYNIAAPVAGFAGVRVMF
jgi:outer membrane receptor protein involved in Fe transport